MVFIKHFKQIVFSLPRQINSFRLSILNFECQIGYLYESFIFPQSFVFKSYKFLCLNLIIYSWYVVWNCNQLIIYSFMWNWYYKGQRLSDNAAEFYDTKLIHILFVRLVVTQNYDQTFLLQPTIFWFILTWFKLV